MKFGLPLERRPADEVRLLWAAAAFALIFGLHIVQSRYEPVIASANARAEDYYTGMRANERLVREAASLHKAERSALADLRRIRRDPSNSSGTAALIAHVSAISRARGVTLTSLQPESTGAHDRGMASTAVTIGVRGRFASVLQLIEDLSHSGTLLRVNGEQLSASASGGKHAGALLLDATILATFYRPDLPIEQGGLYASTR